MKLPTMTALLVLTALAVAAAPPALSLTEATRTGDDVAVAGTATFPAGEGRQCAVELGRGTATPPQQANVADALGIDLKDGCIERLEDGLRFTWVMATPLPPQVPAEVVRYNWAFAAGDQTLQLQAKRTNVVSSTTAEDPVGHAQHLAGGDDGWFQVRGACVSEYLGTPVNGCYHLDFVEGGFDVDAGEVWMILPFHPVDDLGRPYAQEFTAGSTIVEAQSASMSIAASGQAVVSSTATSSFINGWRSFCTGDVVEVGLGNASRSSTLVPVDVDDSGAFGTTLTGAGDWAHASACSGFTSATTKLPVTTG